MITADRVVPTTCPYCGVGCNLELHIKDDYIYKVTSPFDAVVNHGNLCVKGRFGYDFIYNKDRVTTPLIRKKAQAPGARTQAFDRDQWREVSWDEALDYTTNRLVEIYRRDGADAMAVYCCAKATNEDNYLLQKLFRALFRSNHVDHCTRLCHAGSVVALQMALGSSAMSNTAAEVIDSDLFLVTGSNTAETHPIIALQMKAAVANHGAKLIVVDPRRVEMVNWATLWLPEKPGTDVPLFSAMAHVIIKERLYNQDFVDRRTEGFNDFSRSMEKFTPEYAEAISGVDRNLIVQAARMYARAKNAAIYWALGIPEHSHGTDNAMSLIHLALLTGHIGRKGTGLNPLRGQNNVQGASDSGAMPWHYPGYQRVDDEAAARKFEQAWNIEPGGLNRRLGLTTTEILSGVRPGGVRALHIMGENPMMSEPNLNHTRHMMEQLEFLAVQDLFINESGAFADVFLPAASWAEKEGTFTNTDRRVQRVRKALEPRGQSRPDWEIVCDLAGRIERKLGRSQTAFWAYQTPDEVLEEMGRVVPEYAGVKYRRIEKLGLQTPVWDDSHPGTPYLFAESFPRGRGKFHTLEYVPSVEMPDEEYPFILTTGRLLEHWHGGTLTRHSKLDDLYPEARIEINPADGARLKIEDGQAVRVSSRRGSIVLRAWVTQRGGLCSHAFCRSRREPPHHRRLRPVGQDPRVQGLRRAHRHCG
jgi:formate dehydrogenase alpha subunit